MTILWTGKTTDMKKVYTAEGETYKELYEEIQDKYGNDKIIDKDAFEIKLLEVNNEDLDQYEITSDGIGNWELYETFENKEGLRRLSDVNYREIIENSDSQAYYHEFELEEDDE
ncbi:hypothetical protein [Macrococcoides caseolyticum]|uniref:hypothetical protein n=1 Tax=Macrococcoides caseolyticum TaxID=69966 RepID=UPI000C31B9DB|nr:hypothetical protein [Macrococcus caseolyticus]PKE18644.1 hypothetical protein CW679_09570 [Macrococcus caseolyticus]PKF41706.1 hypothetical protein CW661_00795 [Macrococcus caseolyticus]